MVVDYMSDIMEMEIQELELHPYSELTRAYTKDGFRDLINDIEINGLKEPIALVQGKILDGRHRYKALTYIGDPIKYVELGNISDEEALDYVISKSISKDSSSTASKIEAYVLCKAKGVKNKDMPSKFRRLSDNDVKKISKIEKTDEDYLWILLRQNKVRIFDKRYNKWEQVSTINGLWQIIVSNIKVDKENSEELKEIESTESVLRIYEVVVTEYFEGNEEMEEEFWRLWNMAKAEGKDFSPSSTFGLSLMASIKRWNENTN